MYQNVYKYDEMKRAEHMAVRTTAGWYLWTHNLLEVSGKDAAIFLDKIYANPIANLKLGRARYTTMLNDNAEILDDVVVFRLDEDKFWISTLFVKKLIAWLDLHKEGFEVNYADVTPNYHMFAVQGPRSKELINALVTNNIDEQKFFTIADNEIDTLPVKIARTGFTGEKWGYEIYCAAEQVQIIENKIREKAELFEAKQVTDFQIMAWTLPTEAGFYYMRDLLHTNPFEVGLDRGIGWEREFIGKAALERIRDNGATREMLGFTMEQADVHINAMNLGGPGTAIYKDGKEIGRVVKFNYSYVKEICIGYMIVQKDSLKVGDSFKIKDYDAVACEKMFL